MDIQKSQRLSQYVGLIIDMVEYLDLEHFMVQSGVISKEESSHLTRRLRSEGNSAAMNELLAMVNLRRGGFDAFLEALRASDYNWIAEQLAFSGSSLKDKHSSINGSVQNLVSSVRQRMSRNSEPAGLSNQETIFTSYRETCPMDIPLNPSFYEEMNKNKPEVLTTHNNFTSTTTSQGEKDKQVLGMSLKLKTSSKCTEAVIHNMDSLPMSEKNADDIEAVATEYFIDLAKMANVPSPLLANLKVISKKGIFKEKSSRKGKKVKLRFSSEMGRDKFVENVQGFIANLLPTDNMYSTLGKLKISVPTKTSGRSKGLSRFRRKKSCK